MNTPEDQSIEVLPPSAILQLERAQIDGQIATAHAYPRSLDQFKKRATAMATLDLETAESCIYSRPVGGGKTAEGASIRMAEIVAASYGNIRVSAQIIEQTDRYVKTEGVAHDLESNYAAKSQCVEPTVTREGKPYSEGQRAVVAKACQAKAFRDAVFKVVPRALCKSIISAAEKVIRGENVPLESRVQRVRQWLRGLKVDDARVFPVLGVTGWSEVTDEHLIKLTGLKTAIAEQDSTVEDAFPIVAKSPEMTGPGAMAKGAPVPPGTAPKPAAQPKPERQPEPPTCKYCSQPVTDMANHLCEQMKAATQKQAAPEKPQAVEQEMPAPTERTDEAAEEAAEEAAAAAAGLAPAQERPVLPAEEMPEGFVPMKEIAGSDAYNSVVMLANKSFVTEKQIMATLKAKKVSRPEQTALSELAESKLLKVSGTWHALLPEIKQQPAA